MHFKRVADKYGYCSGGDSELELLELPTFFVFKFIVNNPAPKNDKAWDRTQPTQNPWRTGPLQVNSMSGITSSSKQQPQVPSAPMPFKASIFAS
jgi:hypothetical protein